MINRFYNQLKKLKAGLRFPQFSFKLVQIRIFEELVKRRIIRQAPYPVSMVIRITEKCFLRCHFCAQGGDKARVDRKHLDSGPVEIETFRKIMDESSKWLIKPFIKITGGEPLTAGQPLLDAIRDLRQRGFVVKLNSNGVMLRSEELARRLAETDLNYLSISIDGLEETHNKIRGLPIVFQSALQGIKNVDRFRRELKKKNLMILVSMVVSSDNYMEIAALYTILAEYPVDWFNIQFLNYTTEETCAAANSLMHSRYEVEKSPWESFCNPKYNAIDPVEVENQINKILSMRKRLPISVMGGLSSAQKIHDYYFTMKPLSNNICNVPFTGMHIVPPGKACYCIDYPYLEYGDLREQSIAEIWNSKMGQQFKNDLKAYYKEHGKNFPQCQRCNWRFN